MTSPDPNNRIVARCCFSRAARWFCCSTWLAAPLYALACEKRVERLFPDCPSSLTGFLLTGGLLI